MFNGLNIMTQGMSQTFNEFSNKIYNRYGNASVDITQASYNPQYSSQFNRDVMNRLNNPMNYSLNNSKPSSGARDMYGQTNQNAINSKDISVPSENFREYAIAKNTEASKKNIAGVILKGNNDSNKISSSATNIEKSIGSSTKNITNTSDDSIQTSKLKESSKQDEANIELVEKSIENNHQQESSKTDKNVNLSRNGKQVLADDASEELMENVISDEAEGLRTEDELDSEEKNEKEEIEKKAGGDTRHQSVHAGASSRVGDDTIDSRSEAIDSDAKTKTKGESNVLSEEDNKSIDGLEGALASEGVPLVNNAKNSESTKKLSDRMDAEKNMRNRYSQLGYGRVSKTREDIKKEHINDRLSEKKIIDKNNIEMLQKLHIEKQEDKENNLSKHEQFDIKNTATSLGMGEQGAFKPKDAARLSLGSQKVASYLLQQGNNDIVKEAKLILRNNKSGEIKLMLKPKEFGEMKLSFTVEDSKIVGKIVVSSEAARDAVQKSIENLERLFNHEGYEVGGFFVSVDSNASEKNSEESNKKQFDQSLKDNGSHTSQDVYVQKYFSNNSSVVDFVA